MTKQFAKKSIAASVTAAAFALAATTRLRAANQSDDWFEQQRSLTDGAGFDAQAAALSQAKGAKSRVGEPAVSPQGEACSKAQDTALHLHGHRSALVTATTSVLSQESAEGYDAVCLD